MRIGVIGATGFIGGHVVAELRARGHQVRVFVRDRLKWERGPGNPADEVVEDGWEARLGGLDGLVIAVGVMGGPYMVEAHRDLPARLALAARREGVRRLVHISAIGAAPDAPTLFLRSKSEGEAALIAQRLPGWTILRPSLVYGPGGTSMEMLERVAALPIRPRIASGPVRPIAVEDLACAAVDLLESDQPLPETIDAVGPDLVDIDGYIDALGDRLAARPLAKVPVPRPLMDAGASVSGALRLGLMDREAVAMLRQGADGDPRPLAELTSVRPAGLRQGLGGHPASPADRIAAALGFWPELLRYSLVILWIGSGIASLVNVEQGLALLAHGGITGSFAVSIVVAGAVWDLVLGAAMLWKRHVRLVAALQVATMLLYTFLATLIVPSAWTDPLGQLLKNVPILVATLLLMSLPRR